MDVGSVGASQHAAHTFKAPESQEGPGPDHDGDSDDSKAIQASTQQAVGKSATAVGVGTVVDTSA
jgi:hypothetical protein